MLNFPFLFFVYFSMKILIFLSFLSVHFSLVLGQELLSLCPQCPQTSKKPPPIQQNIGDKDYSESSHNVNSYELTEYQILHQTINPGDCNYFYYPLKGKTLLKLHQNKI